MPTLSAVLDIQDRYTRNINKIIGSTKSAEDKIKAISGSTDNLNKKLANIKSGASSGAGGINSLVGSLKGLAAAYLTAQAAQKGMEIADNYTNTAARLSLINDGLQTNAQLQDKIFKAAERSRGSYTDMASSVAKMGLLAKDAFKGNDEIIAFTELVQKSFKVGGASTQEQQSGMYQLTQAMAAGKLQGDEFRSIMENAPMIADAVAKFTGKSKGELKKMSAEGTITADIIKNAMFAMSGDINKKFETMPRTFVDIFTQLGNNALKAFEPVIQKISSIINSPSFASFSNGLIQGINMAAFVLGVLIDGFTWLGSVIQSNWGIIEPILIAIGAALLAWAIVQIPMLAASIWSMVPPIWEAVIGWLAMNWPILLIGAAIGLLLYAMINFGDTVVEVVGFVGGIFGVLFAFLFNKFAYFANIVLSVAEFFINVWKDPIYAVKKLFYDLSINALSFLLNIAKGIENVINKIPGLNVNMTGSMEGLLKTLESQRDNLKSEKDVVKLKKFEQIDYSTAFTKGQEFGKKAGRFAVDGVQGAFDKLSSLTKMPAGADMSGVDKLMKDGAMPVTGKNGNLKVDMSQEDLKYLQDIAEREYVNKFSTATLAPNIKITFGKVTKEADADQVAKRVEKILKEQVAIAAEGSYA